MKQFHEDETQQLTYGLRSIMLTSVSAKRDELNPGPPWTQEEVEKQSLNLALKASPSHGPLSNKSDHYMVKLPVTVEYRIVPKDKEPGLEDRVRMLVEIEYCGVFMASGEPAQVAEFLSTLAPTMLFPYASQTINDLVARAGCLPMFLPPIDFAILKQQAVRQAEADASATRQ